MLSQSDLPAGFQLIRAQIIDNEAAATEAAAKSGSLDQWRVVFEKSGRVTGYEQIWGRGATEDEAEFVASDVTEFATANGAKIYFDAIKPTLDKATNGQGSTVGAGASMTLVAAEKARKSAVGDEGLLDKLRFAGTFKEAAPPVDVFVALVVWRRGSYVSKVLRVSLKGAVSDAAVLSLAETQDERLSKPAAENFAGRWAGTWLSRTGVSGTLGVTIEQQGSSASGTISFTGSPCFSGGKLSGGLDGDSFRGALTAGDIRVDLSSTITGDQMNGEYHTVSGGACTGDVGTFTVDR